MLAITLLGSIFYILFKILEKFLKNNLTSNIYYKLSKIIALAFIIPISYILSLYLPDFNSINFNKFYKQNEPIQQTITESITPTNNNTSSNIISENTLTKSNTLNENININNEKEINKNIDNIKVNINYNLIFKTIYILGLILFIFVNFIFFIKFKITINKSNIILDENYNNILNKVKQNLNINKSILIFENKTIFSPMLVGILNPKIILPKKDIPLQDLEFILTHELIHFKRKDLLTKLILLLINILNFFNPLIYLLIKDIDKWCEYSCDEKLIKIYNNNEKNYCLAILNCLNPSKKTNIHFSTTFACNKNNLKRRLENIMSENKPKNKLKVTFISIFFTLICISFILVFSTFYSNNKINVFANTNFVRNFDEPANFYSKDSFLRTEEPSQKQKKLKVRLKGTFINEEPTSVEQLKLNFYLSNFDQSGSISDNYVKIELENISKHKDDPNDTYNLYCNIYGEYSGYNYDQDKKVYLDTFSVPKKDKTVYVFEVIKPFTRYELELRHKYGHTPSCNITVTTGNTLKDLGVDSITNLSKEETLPINDNNPNVDNILDTKGFRLNVGNYNNLDLQLNNTTNDEYSLFLYDISEDIFSFSNMSVEESIYKEYKIAPNTTFNETLKTARAKRYEAYLVPTELKNDYLKLTKLNIKFEKENKENSKTEKELYDLYEEYIKKYGKIVKKQQGNFYYKCYN